MPDPVQTASSKAAEAFGDLVKKLSHFAWFGALVAAFLASLDLPAGHPLRQAAEGAYRHGRRLQKDAPFWIRRRVSVLKWSLWIYAGLVLVVMPTIMLAIGATVKDIETKLVAEIICVVILGILFVIAQVFNLKAIAAVSFVVGLIKGAPTFDWMPAVGAARLDFGQNTGTAEFWDQVERLIKNRGITFMDGVSGFGRTLYRLFQIPGWIYFWQIVGAAYLTVLPLAYHTVFFGLGLLALAIVLAGRMFWLAKERPDPMRYAARLAASYLVFVLPIWSLVIPVAGWVINYQRMVPLGIALENVTPNLQLLAIVLSLWAVLATAIFPILKPGKLANQIHLGFAGLTALVLVLVFLADRIEGKTWPQVVWGLVLVILVVGGVLSLVRRQVGYAVFCAIAGIVIVWYLSQPPHNSDRQRSDTRSGVVDESSLRTTPAPTPLGRDGFVRTASVVDPATRTEHVVVTVKATMQPLKVRAHGRTTFPTGTVIRVRRESGGVIDLDPYRKAPTVGLVNDRSTGPTARQAFVSDYARACPVPDGIIGFPTVEVRKRTAIVPLQDVTYVLDGKSAVWVDTNMPRDDFLCWGVVTLRGVVGRTLRSFTPHPWRKEGLGSFTVHVWVTLPAPPTVVAPSSSHSSGRLLHQGAPAFSYPQGMVV